MTEQEKIYVMAGKTADRERYQNAIHDLLQACVGAYAKNTSSEEFEQMMPSVATTVDFR